MLPFRHERIGKGLGAAAIIGVAGCAQDRDQRPIPGARGVFCSKAFGGSEKRGAGLEPVDPVMLDDEAKSFHGTW